MIEEYFRRRPHLHQVLSTPAGPYLEGLATHLVRQGFSRWKLRQRLHGAAHFSLWRGMSGGALDQLHEEALPAFAKHLRSCECPGRFRRSAHSDGSAVAGAIELVQHLRWLGVVRLPAPAVAPSTEPELVRGFSEWMRHCRCVKDNTLRGYIRVILEVLDVLGDSPKDYTARSLRAFVLKTTDGATRSMGKQVVTAMRHFLRYLIAHGQCDVGLDGAIPTLAMWRLSAQLRARTFCTCGNATATRIRVLSEKRGPASIGHPPGARKQPSGARVSTQDAQRPRKTHERALRRHIRLVLGLVTRLVHPPVRPVE